MASIQSLVYFQAFEHFPFEELVFRVKVAKEIKIVELCRKLQKSPFKHERVIAHQMVTPFGKVHSDIESNRAKAKFAGVTITAKMVKLYTD